MSDDPKKLDVLLKAVGDAPIMKQRKWAVEGGKTMAYIYAFVRRRLKLTADQTLFVYVNQCFAPSPDQTLDNLFACFGADGKLVLHYSLSQAWG